MLNFIMFVPQKLSTMTGDDEFAGLLDLRSSLPIEGRVASDRNLEISVLVGHGDCPTRAEHSRFDELADLLRVSARGQVILVANRLDIAPVLRGCQVVHRLEVYVATHVRKPQEDIAHSLEEARGIVSPPPSLGESSSMF